MHRSMGNMTRLTITLSDERYRALKERADRTGTTISEVIERSLEAYGVRGEPTGRKLIEQARAHSGLTEEAAMKIALGETRAARRARTQRQP